MREQDLHTGFAHGSSADLMVCAGSSMRVHPAASMVEETVGHGGKLFIINLQATPISPLGVHIFAPIDKVFEMVFEKLNMVIPPFKLKRHAEILNEQNKITIRGIDTNNRPYSLFKKISIPKNDA